MAAKAQQQHPSTIVRGKHLRAVDMLDSRTWTELEIVCGLHDDKGQLLNDAIARLDKLDELVKRFSEKVKKHGKGIFDEENGDLIASLSKEGERLFRSATAFGLRLGNIIDPTTSDHRIAERVLLIAFEMTDPKKGPLRFEHSFNTRLRAVALNNLATVLAQAKRFVEAIDRVQLARGLEAELGPAAESPATTMFNEAQIYVLAGRTHDALNAFYNTVQVLQHNNEKALNLREKATTGSLLLAALRQLAGLCQATHRYEDAIATLEGALNVAREVEKTNLSRAKTDMASDVVVREHEGKKMTAVREAIAADLKRCQRVLEGVRRRPRAGAIHPIELPQPSQFADDDANNNSMFPQQQQPQTLAQMQYAARKKMMSQGRPAHHNEWTTSPAVLDGNLTCVAQAETLKLTKRASGSPDRSKRRRGGSRSGGGGDGGGEERPLNVDETKSKYAMRAALAEIPENAHVTATTAAARARSSSLTRKNQQQQSVASAGLSREQLAVLDKDYYPPAPSASSKSQAAAAAAAPAAAAVSLAPLDDVVRSLPKTLRDAFVSLHTKGLQEKVIVDTTTTVVPSSSSINNNKKSSSSEARSGSHQQAATTTSVVGKKPAAATQPSLSSMFASEEVGPPSATQVMEQQQKLPSLFVAAERHQQRRESEEHQAADRQPSAASAASSVQQQQGGGAPPPQQQLVVRPPRSIGGFAAFAGQPRSSAIRQSRPQSAPSATSPQQQQQQQQQRFLQPPATAQPHSRGPSPHELTPSPERTAHRKIPHPPPLPTSVASSIPALSGTASGGDDRALSGTLPSAAQSHSGVEQQQQRTTSPVGSAHHPSRPVTPSFGGGDGGSTSRGMSPHISPKPTQPVGSTAATAGSSTTLMSGTSSSLAGAMRSLLRPGSAKLSRIDSYRTTTSQASASASSRVFQSSHMPYHRSSVGPPPLSGPITLHEPSSKSGRTGRPRSYNPKSVDDILCMTFSPKRSLHGGSSSKRRGSEATNTQFEDAAAQALREAATQAAVAAALAEAKAEMNKPKFTKDEAATVITRFLSSRPSRVIVVDKQREFLEEQVRVLVGEQRRSAIMLAREEMQNHAMAKAATDFVSAWSDMQVTNTGRSKATREASEAAERAVRQRRQSRESFLEQAKTIMEVLERTELSLAARGSEHAEYLRKDTVTKFLRRNDGVRIMQALLRAVDSINIRGQLDFERLSQELAAVRLHNRHVAMVTKLQRWFRRKASLEVRKKAARARRKERLEKLTAVQLQISAALRAQEACRVVYRRKCFRVALCVSKFAALVRGAAVRAKLPYYRWEHERFLERKELQSILLIQHMWVFWKLMTEFVDPFRGLSVEEVNTGRRQYAALRIQCCFRRYIYGKPIADVLKAKQAQKANEMRIMICVISIQRWWHRVRARHLFCKLRDTETQLKQAYEQQQLRRWAGDVIFRFLRWASRRLRQEEIARWEAEFAKKKFIQSDAMRRYYCARTIQRAYRAHHAYRCAVVAAFDANPPFALNPVLAARVDVLRDANLTRNLRDNHPALIRCVKLRRAGVERRRRLSLREELHHEVALDESARIIQRAWKQHVARREMLSKV